MAQALEIPQKMILGRGRGLLLVCRRELERKLHNNRYLPRQSRGATLETMAQMNRCPGCRPGTNSETPCNYDNGDTKSTSTQYCQMSPQPEETPQRLPTTLPR